MQHDNKLKNYEFINSIEVNRAKPIVKLSKGFISFDWIIRSYQEVKSSDIVIINLPQAEGFVPASFAKLLGRKIISIYHCEVVLPKGLINFLVERLLNFANTLTLYLSDTVITYTEDFAINSKILPKFKRKLQYCYPPIIKPKINKRVQKMIKRKILKRPSLDGFKGPALIIGVAARLAAEKGIEYLLEAIPEIDSVIARSEERATRQSRTGSPPPRLKLGVAMTRNCRPIRWK